jgi:hypothetical protein
MQPPIGERLFTDGITRPVYEDEHGQFVLEDGERIDGIWLVADEPAVVAQPKEILP